MRDCFPNSRLLPILSAVDKSPRLGLRVPFFCDFLEGDRMEFRRDIADAGSIPDFIAQQESLAVRALNKGSPLHCHCMRDERSTHDSVIFVEQYPCEEIKMRAAEIPDCGQLARAVVSRNPAVLNLIPNSVMADSVDVGTRVARLLPPECFGEKVLCQVAGRIVRAFRDASRTKLVRNPRMQRQQFGSR
jgi:hypothetical protein